jgi:phosphate transport system protein
VRALGNEVLMLLGDAVGPRCDGAPSPERLGALLVAVTERADDVERECFALLARQQPVASDLRGILCGLAFVQELYECARQAVGLVRRSPTLDGAPALPSTVGDLLALMAAQASVELSLALEAFTEASLPLADALRDIDDVMNGLQRDLLRELTDHAPANGPELAGLIQAALAARVFERMGDRAVECADRVMFWLTGEAPGGRSEDPILTSS